MPLTVESLRKRIQSLGDNSAGGTFDLLRDIATYINRVRDTSSAPTAQELVVRLLDARTRLVGYEDILIEFIRDAGLFPYLEPAKLSLSDTLAYEAHRPGANARTTVFHRMQAKVFHTLMTGRSVVLSAPTSFGKSLIVDAIVESNKHTNIVIVVPTLALLDEVRRRLARFSHLYKIITHSSQTPGVRNIFVHTQERVLENKNIQNVDFFVIDEFYKLNPKQDVERAQTLNLAFYKLAQQAKQFYMLGPNIEGIPLAFENRFDCVFERTDFNTVASEVHRINADDDVEHALQLCASLREPTLIYVRSPARAKQFSARLAQVLGPLNNGFGAIHAADWVRGNYHPEWSFATALDRGIGIHHGRLPRALAQMVVREFNQGTLKYLVCTSTLIEGVNTRAKNVIILDNKIASKKFDYFTFANIRGRSGRMFQHYIGNVYLYHEPPQQELPLVDIPIITQTEDASDALLIHIEPSELTEASRERVARYLESPLLDIELLKQNAGISPEAQLAVAQAIVRDLSTSHTMLGWRGYPEWEQFKWTCELIWEHFTDRRRRSGASSGAQLAFLLWKVLAAKSFQDVVAVFRTDGIHIEDAIDLALDFQRQWSEFRAPNLLSALNRIQQHIFRRFNLTPGNYDAYIAHIENLGRSPVVNALDEYGLPVQIGEVIWRATGVPDSLDDALSRLRQLDLSTVKLSPFEFALVQTVQATL
ncbi:putative helicase HelY [Pandoraea pneumonica]|uniref:Putative helicase HelY n=1 Tax=Pandoraea pneumonica TaxID=2508299 RepID=A0A5E4RHY9_9BURK|nr:DEAD/DEAH box helicase [Pandoraea pneumonica]VVD62970.1 putative helicase HelY [Pandoraea pneumonica]